MGDFIQLCDELKNFVDDGILNCQKMNVFCINHYNSNTNELDFFEDLQAVMDAFKRMKIKLDNKVVFVNKDTK